ncbi:MAG TPA: Rossmann-like and DUF2520 domain-containing protein [Pyrinomonadaceae bacterium]|jgi:predicted short-subunit dehydrogenase-like oxidoreductase (DUF2520 family)|nr:Rossmann-like and DUF2520 domain-containing protein [Pyrinomonadaceae bacterium]
MTDRKRKQKPEVSIIGSGRLGTTLAVVLARRGYPIQSLVGRTLQSARKAARFLDAEVQVLAAGRLHSLRPASIFLITVPDDQIAGVAEELSRVDFNSGRGPTAFHTSGALSSDLLEPLRKKGWHTGSIHPLVSVSHAGAPLEGGFWSVEGDNSAVRTGKAMVRDLGGKSFSIRTEDKPLYHAAAVMVSGNVVALFDVALEMLADCGLKRQTAQEILLPLITSTVRNLETKDPAHALTGTFSRGDLETVKRHLAALNGNQEALELYRLLGKRSLRLTKKHPQITQMLDSV